MKKKEMKSLLVQLESRLNILEDKNDNLGKDLEAFKDTQSNSTLQALLLGKESLTHINTLEKDMISLKDAPSPSVLTVTEYNQALGELEKKGALRESTFMGYLEEVKEIWKQIKERGVSSYELEQLQSQVHDEISPDLTELQGKVEDFTQNIVDLQSETVELRKGICSLRYTLEELQKGPDRVGSLEELKDGLSKTNLAVTQLQADIEAVKLGHGALEDIESEFSAVQVRLEYLESGLSTLQGNPKE